MSDPASLPRFDAARLLALAGVLLVAFGIVIGEIYAIYMDPGAAGRGLGRQLIAAAEDQLGKLGFSKGELWVLDRNSRARHFYEAAGWAVAGAELRIERIGGVDANEVCYRKDLMRVPGPTQK